MHRISTRIALVTPQKRFLLFLSHFSPGSNLPPRWIFPGGGVEANESLLDCAIREVHEETGLLLDTGSIHDLGQTLSFTQEDQREFKTGQSHFYRVQISDEFTPDSSRWTQEEIRDTVTHRWWSIEEILEEEPWVGPDGVLEILHDLIG